jgi:anti-anti-sigma factor
MTDSGRGGPLVTVRFVAVPLDVHRRVSEHHDTLNRELALVAETGGQGTVPARLLALSEELRNQFSGFTVAAEERLAAALARGDTTIDLEYTLPPAAAEGAARLDAMLDEVEAYCIDGALLTLVGSPEIVAYRKWLLGEFVRQITDGEAPTPWAQYRDAAASLPMGDPTAAATEGSTQARTDPGGVVGEDRVSVPGDLDLDGATALRATLLAGMDRGDVDVVVDLANCTFLDSVGLSLLLTTRARCVDAGGRLRVVNPRDQPARALELAGVLDLLTDGRAP